MKPETIKDFRKWCLVKVSKSRGTTDMYSAMLKRTPDISMEDDYMATFRMLNGRVNSDTSRAAHGLFLRFLKQKTFDDNSRRDIGRLMADLKDMDIGSDKNKRYGELKERTFTLEELGYIREYVKGLMMMRTKCFGNRILCPCEILLNRICIDTLYDTAGRGNEVCQYTFGMLDLKDESINVTRAITKRHKSRKADLSTNTVALIEEYIKTCNPDMKGRIFVQFRDVRQMRSFVKKVTKAAIGRECTLHYFRNSFATHYAEEKLAEKPPVHISIIAENLRMYFNHSNIMTSMHYIKIAQENIRERLIKS